MVIFLEGNIFLIFVLAIVKCIGKDVRVFVKYDGLNFIGSFKDWGMIMVIFKVKEVGVKVVICVSIGNILVVVVVYVWWVGLWVFVIIFDGYVVLGKLG